MKDGVVYFGNENDTRAYQLPDQITEPFAVKELWLAAKLIVDRIYSSPVYHQGFLYLMDMDCNVIVLDAATGKQVKTFRTQGDGYASMAVAGDTLLAGCISAFSTKDFSELGKIPMRMTGTLGISGDKLYVRTQSKPNSSTVLCYKLSKE